MEWLSSRVKLIRDAYRHRKILITAAIAMCAFVGAFDPVTEWIKNKLIISTSIPVSGEGKVIFGFPSWYVAAILLLSVLLIVIFEYAFTLYQKLQPRFNISFPISGMAIVAGVDRELLLFGGQVQYGPPFRTRYIRIQIDIDETSKAPLTDCVAGITELDKQISGTTNFINVSILKRFSWRRSHFLYIQTCHALLIFYELMNVITN